MIRSSRRKRQHDRPKADITPMVDMVFLLIIFFVMTLTINDLNILEGIKRPHAAHAYDPSNVPHLTVQVDQHGICHIGGDAVRTPAAVRDVVRQAKRAAGGRALPVVIRGDRRASHGAIRVAMDACAKEGITQIKFGALK